METQRVNEETKEGNFVIELLVDGKWNYILTEFSASVSTDIMINLNNATNYKCRVLSRRSNNMIIGETK